MITGSTAAHLARSLPYWALAGSRCRTAISLAPTQLSRSSREHTTHAGAAAVNACTTHRGPPIVS